MKRAASGLVLISAILWGSMGIVTRYVAEIGFHTRQTAAVRICSAAMVLFLYLIVLDRKKLKIHKEDVKWFLGAGLGSLFINNLAYAETVQRASLSLAVILLYTAPFFVMILSVIFFHEKLTVQKVAALILSFAGCVLTAGLSDSGLGKNPGITVLIGLCAGFGYSLYSIFGKFLVGKYDSMTVTAYTFFVASIASFAISEPGELFRIMGEHLEQMPLIVLGSVITLALPYLIYSYALRYIESSKASIIASFEVAAASLFGVILYQERLDIFNIEGILCVILALILLQINFSKKLE